MEAKNYKNFDLNIVQVDQDRYRVAVESQFGQASSEFTPPFSELDLEAFVQNSGRPRSASRHLGVVEQERAFSPQELGALLFDTIFTGVTSDCFSGSLALARQSNAGLRIRLDLTQAPNLINVPWEFLFDPAAARFLSLSVETPITRRLTTPERIAPLAAVQPLQVLVMISSPQDYPPLDTDQEWTRLRNAAADLEQRGLIQIERMQTATLAELQRRLREKNYHILHFIGHGGFDEQANESTLVLEDESHMGRPASATFLGTLLHDAKTIRLVVLNACEGGRTSHVDPFAGAAQGLLRQGVPAAVAMQFEITDRAAITFSHEFYAAIASGYPLDSAVVEARKAIYADQNMLEWGTPVLYMNTPDGQVFQVETPDSAAVTPPTAANLTGNALPSQPYGSTNGSLAQRLFAGPDSIGFRIGRYSAVLAVLCLVLASDTSGLLTVLLLGLTFLTISSKTRSQNLTGLIVLVAGLGLAALQGQIQKLGVEGLLLGLGLAALLLLLAVSATLIFTRPISPGYRVALIGVGLGIGSMLLLTVADPLTSATFVHVSADSYAIILLWVLVVWRAIDSVRRDLEIAWRDSLLVTVIGSIALVLTVFEAYLGHQVVLGHVANVVASMLIIRGGMRNFADSRGITPTTPSRLTESNSPITANNGQAHIASGQDMAPGERPITIGVETLTIMHPISIELVRVPGGEFIMGSDPSNEEAARPDEQPQHRLYLPQFYIGKYPVTSQQYAAFVSATGHHSPEQWPDGKIPPRMDNHPITHVSRQSAFAFCDWLSKESGFSVRLPTEAEWEKAARGSDGRLYPWGNEPPTPERCNFKETKIEGTTPVDRFADGASPFGALDMLGNIQEWTGSIYRIDSANTFGYPYAASDGRELLRSQGDFDLAQRGGSYLSDKSDLGCARRFREGALNVGFRIAVSLQQSGNPA